MPSGYSLLNWCTSHDLWVGGSIKNSEKGKRTSNFFSMCSINKDVLTYSVTCVKFSRVTWSQFQYEFWTNFRLSMSFTSTGANWMASLIFAKLDNTFSFILRCHSRLSLIFMIYYLLCTMLYSFISLMYINLILINVLEVFTISTRYKNKSTNFASLNHL